MLSTLRFRAGESSAGDHTGIVMMATTQGPSTCPRIRSDGARDDNLWRVNDRVNDVERSTRVGLVGSSKTGALKLLPEVRTGHFYDAAHFVQAGAHTLSNAVAKRLFAR